MTELVEPAMTILKALLGLLKGRLTARERKALMVLEEACWLADADLDRHGLSRKDMSRLIAPPDPLVKASTTRFLSGRSIVHYGLTDRGVHEARVLRDSNKQGWWRYRKPSLGSPRTPR